MGLWILVVLLLGRSVFRCSEAWSKTEIERLCWHELKEGPCASVAHVVHHVCVRQVF